MPKIIEATVMVIDMPGFTRFVSKNDLQTTFDFVDCYYNFVGDIVDTNAGRIIKYIGDGILILFENDNDNAADNSVKSACEIQENEDYCVNCSIHTGELIIGELGHPKLRNVDIIGDTINITYRQLFLNKQYNIESPYIFITEQTKKMMEYNYKSKEIGEFLVKGMDLLIKSYQIY